MRIDQQPAYVLHARPYRETSLLLECLTRDHGRVGLVARGVRGERARLARAELEPFLPLALSWRMRGELGTLAGAEAAGAPQRLAGDALLAGLYLNELVVRLVARQDSHPELFGAYALALGRLAAGESLAWTLRRFERDLLDALGYGLLLDRQAEDETPLQPQADYVYLPEQGPQPWRGQPGPRVRGADLLALAADRMPDPEGLAALRRMMRAVIAAHLGGGELRAWRVLGEALRHR
ncbi:DNA replication and repair protein RecO [Mizugakiibacter sediminis]|uniref:DNA repair protein RecO n=1 Tax=Mizugakiibacter sediminis TaxID=1475481 RepID=A0A0K8QJU7_9GAMM|nr:DNA repair protein RecO [Mizugakiibacter sediminis]GAP64747.1 DNA replication and repair protein RecO [Mizugakiibacter sediminis]